MRPSTAEGWYVLPIIVVSFPKFRGKKPGALGPVNAHNRMRSHVMAGLVPAIHVFDAARL
jgi:hypothetical protein